MQHLRKSYHITKKIIHIKLTVLVLLLLPIVVFTLIVSNTKLIQRFHSYVVMSGSMTPTLPVGSLIYTQQELGYNIGDVVSFKNAKGDTVTHRVVAVKNDHGMISYQVKGDANNSPDAEFVPEDQINGRMYLSVPSVGRFIVFAKTPRGLLTFIVIPSVIFILFELWNIKKEIEKETEKRVRKLLSIE